MVFSREIRCFQTLFKFRRFRPFQHNFELPLETNKFQKQNLTKCLALEKE